MKYRALDKNGDYSFGKNMQDFIAETEAVSQAIRTNLLLLKGEWWEDLNEGIPLFQSIFGSGTPDRVKAADLLVRERITKTKGVSEILDFQSVYESNNRSYMVSCTVKTTTGSTATVEVTF